MSNQFKQLLGLGARFLLIFTLVFQVSLGSALPAFAQAARNANARALSDEQLKLVIREAIPGDIAAGRPSPLTREVADANMSPAAQMLTRAGVTPELMAVGHALQVPADSDLRDQDPFFMRSQSFSARVQPTSQTVIVGDEEEGQFEVTETASETIVTIAGAARSWHIRQPLHFLGLADNFMFFSARQGSNLLETGGEGLFFVAFNEFLQANVENKATPFYFLALPGEGWMGRVVLNDLSARDFVDVVSTRGEHMQIRIQDVRMAQRFARLNYGLAVVVHSTHRLADGPSPNALNLLRDLAAARVAAAGHPVEDTGTLRSLMARVGEEDTIPPSGWTSAHGMIYSGPMTLGSLDGRHAGVQELIFKILRKLNNELGIPSAHAGPEEIQRSIEGFLWILTVTGAIGGLAVATNIAIKTIESKFPATRELLRRMGFQNTPEMGGKNPLEFLVNQVKAAGTTTAQMMLVIFQLPYFANGLTIQYFADRMLPQMASENKMLRKIINFSFIRAMNNFGNVVVRYKELIAGVFLGIFDSFDVTVQCLWFNNWVFQKVGELFPFMAERTQAALESPSLTEFMVTNVLSNIAVWIIAGAYFLQAEIQTGLEVQIRDRVVRELRAQGINPATNQALVNERTLQEMDVESKRLGFPQEKDLFISIKGLIAGSQGMLGYKSPAGQNPQDYLGVTRSGLMKPALEGALADLEQLIVENPNNILFFQAREILKRKIADYSFVKTAFRGFHVKTPVNSMRDAVNRYRNLREEFTSITLTADVQGFGSPNPPQSWVNMYPGTRAAEVASQLVAKNLRNFVADDKVSYDEWLQNNYAREQGQTLPLTIRNREAAEAAAVTTPPVVDPLADREHSGWFARWQLKRAYKRVNVEFTKWMQQGSVDLNTKEGWKVAQEAHRNMLRDELVKTNGIRPDYNNTQLISTVEEVVETQWQQRLKEPGFERELNKHNDWDRYRIEETIKADLFSAQYPKTVESMGISAFDGAQVGRFQAQRQAMQNSDWAVVRAAGRVATPVLRFFEAHWADDQYQRGGYAYIVRQWLPAWHYMWLGMPKSYVPLATVMTTEYLYNHFILDVVPAWESYLSFKLFLYGLTVKGGWITMNQICKFLGINPNKNLFTVSMFALVGGWYTFLGPIALGLFNPEREWMLQNPFLASAAILGGYAAFVHRQEIAKKAKEMAASARTGVTNAVESTGRAVSNFVNRLLGHSSTANRCKTALGGSDDDGYPVDITVEEVQSSLPRTGSEG